MPESGFTIDELAARAGTTTRNVRAYQSRGLLPSPTVVGRVGYYGDGHLARLRLISTLQGRGYSLASIADLLRGWEEGQSIGDLLGFEEELASPWRDEPEHFVTREQLRELFGDDPAALARSLELGLFTETEGGYRIFSAPLLDAAAKLVAAGVPLDDVIDEAARLKEDADRIAERFVALFIDNVWTPYVRAGKPADELPKVTEALRRLRPLAGTTTLAFLREALTNQTGDILSEMMMSLETTERAS